MRHTTSSRIAVLLAALAAVGMIAPAVTAAGIDTETTNTVQTSALTDGDVLSSSFDGTLSQAYNVTITTTTTNPGLEVVDPDTGETLRTYTEDSDQVTQTYSGTNTYYYNVTLERDDLAGFPIEAGETKNVSLEIVDNETVDEANESNSTINVELTAAGGYSQLWLGSAAADQGVLSFATAGIDIPFAGTLSENNYSEIERESVAINGSGSTIEVSVANSTTASNFDTAFDAVDTGDWALSAPVEVDGDLHKTFLNEAPDDIDSSSTYGVYDASSEELTVYVGDEYEDTDSVDLNVQANNAPGIFETITGYGINNVSRLSVSGLLPF
jgi:hypothetical protein